MDKTAALASGILRGIGGEQNIQRLENCMTRVRVEVHNDDQLDVPRLKQLSGVSGYVKQGQQHQLIVGPFKTEVCERAAKCGVGFVKHGAGLEISGRVAAVKLRVMVSQSKCHRIGRAAKRAEVVMLQRWMQMRRRQRQRLVPTVQTAAAKVQIGLARQRPDRARAKLLNLLLMACRRSSSGHFQLSF